MDDCITTLQPASLWNHFNALCAIPHPSGHMQAITDYIIAFAMQHRLSCRVDEAGNILLSKPAAPGYEERKSILLQAHIDMVPQKNAAIKHDFLTDPIRPYVDGEWVTAHDTSLGADNGIGVAALLAVLEPDSVVCGAIEALFTVDEETGMGGARLLAPDFFKSEVMINTDSEVEGELVVGCTGGLDVDISFCFRHEPIDADDDVAVLLSLTGLSGGHSGVDIHRGRANANKLIFRFLKYAVQMYEARLSWVRGGTLRNAIARESFALLTIPSDLKDDFMAEVGRYESLFRDEYSGIEATLFFRAEATDMPDTWIPECIQDDLINAVMACQDGVYRYCHRFPGLAESSSNLALIESDSESIRLKILIRSLSDPVKEYLYSSFHSLFSMAGAKVSYSSNYCAWPARLDSPLLNEMIVVYRRQFGAEPRVRVMHAGLECGVIAEKRPDLDLVSVGPTMLYPHSPDEKVNIESVDRFYRYLVSVLEQVEF